MIDLDNPQIRTSTTSVEIPEGLRPAVSLVVKAFGGRIVGVAPRKPVPEPPSQVSEDACWLREFIESGQADLLEPFELRPGINVPGPGWFCRTLLSNLKNPEPRERGDTEGPRRINH